MRVWDLGITGMGLTGDTTLYKPDPDESLINQIQEIRTKNNRNWMNMLRLAFKYAPQEAKEIMQNITECDAQINKLSKKLAGGK